MWYVYALIEKLTQEVRYIGCSKAPKRRLSEHSRHRSRSVGRWILEHGKPELAIVASFDDLADAIECERRTIARCERMGFRLLNRASEPYYDPNVVKRTAERNSVTLNCYGVTCNSVTLEQPTTTELSRYLGELSLTLKR